MANTSPYHLYALLIFAVLLNIGMWLYSHRHQPVWPNVPEPPGKTSLMFSFLGDKALAYRVWAIALQNFGNAGGNYKSLADYDYDNVSLWLNLLENLEPESNFTPLLAAYYFGATTRPEQLPPIIAYLERVGSNPEGEEWRWLAHAVYLARHGMRDMPEALRLAKKLGGMYREGMPAWTLQMQALITAEEMGDKEAAYVLLKSMLATETEHMQGPEINFMVDYICTRILTPQQAPYDPLCATESTP